MYIFFTIGVLSSFFRCETLPDIRIPANEAFVEGTVVDVPEMSEGRLRFSIDRVNLNGRKIQGKIRLNIVQNNFADSLTKLSLSRGAVVRAAVKIHRPRMFRNPGVYAYDLRKDGIAATGYVKRLRIIGSRGGPLQWIFNKRQQLGRIIDNSFSTEIASFLKAIIPGLRKGIGRDMKDSFSATGLAHLLSISGTHFGLLSFIFFVSARTVIKLLPLKWLALMTLYLTPSQAAVLLTLPVIIFYALISGMSIPTVRSLIMISIFMTALLLGRKGQWLNSLAVASIIILLWQPYALFELSFQLSFLAVLSIGSALERRTLNTEHRTQNTERSRSDPSRRATAGTRTKKPEHVTKMKKIKKRISDKINTTVLMTISAVLGTAPVAALVFKQFPVISPLTNLTVTPLVCFIILPLGFITGFSALLFDMHSMPLNGLTASAVHTSFRLVKLFSGIPYASVHVPDPSPLLILLYFASFMLIIKTEFRWRFIPLIIVICLYLAVPLLTGDNLRITFLDVGQGDAAVVELPDSKIMLIDGGTLEPEAGRLVVAPFLWSMGVTKIDYIALSHAHPDHYGGLVYIMDNFEIGEIWTNGRVLPEAGALYKKIREKKIQGKVLKRGSVLEESDYRIYVLHPYDTFYAESPRGAYSVQNSDSLVLKIEDAHVSVLFTGDIEKEAEENLILLGPWLKSNIIKVPHHGARESSSAEFIHAVSPGTAVISAGVDNPFRHPHTETLARYQHAGTGILRTDINGAVTIISKGRSYEIRTYEDSVFRKVAGWSDEVRNLRLLL